LLASDGSSVDFFKAGVTTAHFNDEGKMASETMHWRAGWWMERAR